MATFGEAVELATRAAACTILASDPNVVALLERTGLSGNPLANAGRAFRLAFCGNNNNFGTPAPAPGGQCVTNYLVDGVGEYTISTDTTRRTSNFAAVTLRGPMTNARVVQEGNIIRWLINAFNRTTGAPVVHQLGTVTASLAQVSAGTFQSLTFIRSDGQPDNCGSGSPSFPPPTAGPITAPISITFNNNNNVETTLNGSVNLFAPVFAPTFSPRIPIRLSLGGLTFNGNLNVDGTLDLDLDLNAGPGSGRPAPEPPDGEPPAADTVIIGARVVVVSNTGKSATIIYNGDNPDLFVPRAGVIQFLQPAGSASAWSADIPIKTSPQWVPCPPPGFASRISFTAAKGVVLSVTAVLGRPPAG